MCVRGRTCLERDTVLCLGWVRSVYWRSYVVGLMTEWRWGSLDDCSADVTACSSLIFPEWGVQLGLGLGSVHMLHVLDGCFLSRFGRWGLGLGSSVEFACGGWGFWEVDS
eukprot:1336750-Amorphochlora_amoeboformis.AAC.3